ncbi:MAG TPA: hypothetical protein VG095_05395, partial [Chthoniobacterales bacterium]|nr:hypothetical protein [Chthoniobacterales bacterium]
QNSAVRREALRALAADAITRNDRNTARRWATELRNEAGGAFSDALLYFEAVSRTDAAAPVLEELQKEAAATPASTAEFITWLNRHSLAQVALHWSTTLPTEIASAQPVPLAVAESFSMQQDWNGLRAHVSGKNWGAVESLRLAVESHASRRLSPPERPSLEAQTLWRAALQAARAHPEQLLAIAQLAQGWGYQAEAEETWWELASRPEHARNSLSALQNLYKAKQDTRGLLRVAKRALELNPNDLVAANNCASLGLLLNGDSTARRLALRLHNEHPNNRAFAATYAFALHSEGKRAEALRVIEKLKEEELHVPAIAAYYVVMLVENGKLERARAFLAHAERASLLPEERQLLANATRKLVSTGEKLAGM